MTVPTDGIILLAKQSGITSFSSLWQIKNALGTKKIGHTGTLDTFAEGLLVVLSGRLTRLCSYITDCDKEYEALVVFGSETDTLDPEGSVIAQAPLPTLASITDAISHFSGEIQQQPPVYSAVHVSGKRASDRIRNGEIIDLPSRPVTIYSIDILDVSLDGNIDESHALVKSVILRVSCSKGTYIRSLARDIALATGSRAYLGALRRLRIGPFSLNDAAGVSMLAPFACVVPSVYGKGEKPLQVPAEEIVQSVKSFNPEMATIVGLPPVILNPDRLTDFYNGKTLASSWFNELPASFGTSSKVSVFCREHFIGVVSISQGIPSYEFVAGTEV